MNHFFCSSHNVLKVRAQKEKKQVLVSRPASRFPPQQLSLSLTQEKIHNQRRTQQQGTFQVLLLREDGWPTSIHS
jgi:hypothetical protein